MQAGRELVNEFGEVPKANITKKVIVVGAGPAGLKVASLTKQAGHQVTLHGSFQQLGVQVLLAQTRAG